MTPDHPSSNIADDNPEAPDQSRLHLIWELIVFQFKLAADGLRDVILVPVSLVAGVVGLLVGGKDPGQFFRRVLRFGRRTEIWINLFGYRRHAGTSDRLIDPIRQRVFTEAETNPWLRKAGSHLNRSLDSVGNAINRKPGADAAPGPKPPSQDP